MLVADTCAAAADLAPADTVRQVQPDEVPPQVRDLLQLLSPLDTAAGAWTGTLEGVETDTAGRSPLVAVERAPSSQFAALQAALRAGASLPDDVTCIALEGDGFRGQRGRTWAALRGNLHVCRLARLDADATSIQAALTALPAVATVAAIERASAGAITPGIKWVNDLLVSGHKVGGVLAATQIANERVTHVLFGIGVNVREKPALERDPRVAPAGSLTALVGAAAPTLRATTLALWEALDTAITALRTGDADEIIEAYRRHSLAPGRRVALWPVSDTAPGEAPERTGTVRTVRDDLGLELSDGAIVRSGRMTFLD